MLLRIEVASSNRITSNTQSNRKFQIQFFEKERRAGWWLAAARGGGAWCQHLVMLSSIHTDVDKYICCIEVKYLHHEILVEEEPACERV
jgi:hypothetical protein